MASEEPKSAYVYVLTNDRGNVLYVCATDNLKKRAYHHKHRLVPGFTKRYKVHRLVYFGSHQSMVAARTREKQLKGKVGKAVEFGRKWIVNYYSGGYVLVTAPDNPKISDQHCVIESLSLHSTVFDEMPKTYGTDRAMSSVENLELCLSAGVKNIAIQPKGRRSALVSRQHQRRLANRRAGIEPRIAHLKARGMGQSRMKSDLGDLISGYRSALSCNLSLLMRDLLANPMRGLPQVLRPVPQKS